MNKKKICIFTSSRSDYGSLLLLMKEIKKSKNFILQIVVSGTHLSKEFGMSYKIIDKDNFKINKKIKNTSSSDTYEAINKSAAILLLKLPNILKRLKPDILILVGDRYETLAAAYVAHISNIPIGHIGGGEVTVGATDDAFRHSITKMSSLHFVTRKEYKRRIIQLGENPKKIFFVGDTSQEHIKKTALLEKNIIKRKLRINFLEKNVLVTYHPVTLEKNTSKKQFSEILKALDRLKNTNIIFTYPNSDVDGRIIIKMINNFVKKNKNNSVAFKNLGHINFLSVLKNVDILIGNSSSGITDAPIFKVATIDIGDRQKGRIKPKSVIMCKPTKKEILNSIKKAYSSNFNKKIKKMKIASLKSKGTKEILKILKNELPIKNLKKEFLDKKF